MIDFENLQDLLMKNNSKQSLVFEKFRKIFSRTLNYHITLMLHAIKSVENALLTVETNQHIFQRYAAQTTFLIICPIKLIDFHFLFDLRK